jgi:hypothetical protein
MDTFMYWANSLQVKNLFQFAPITLMSTREQGAINNTKSRTSKMYQAKQTEAKIKQLSRIPSE